MQKLKINVKTADFKAGRFVEEQITAVVASTKSQNNLVEEMKEQGYLVGKIVVEELFLDKQATQNDIAEMVFKQIKENDVATDVVNHIMKALDGACVFKKPAVVRKK